MKKYFLLLLSFCSIANASYTQTFVSGGIYNNITWDTAGSPYIVTGDIVVFPNKILTIQPGVEVKFNNNYFLEIRGILSSIGTKQMPIIYTSTLINSYPFTLNCPLDSSGNATINMQDSSKWKGVIIKNTQGAKASFEYCNFSYASRAVEVECCGGGGPIYFKNCKFNRNTFALTGYTGYVNSVDSCEFTNNIYAVIQADKHISNSTFINNGYGLYQTERIRVSKSSFINNCIALYGGREKIDSCKINYNSIGIKGFYGGFEISNSEILNNDKGILATSYDGYYSPIKKNKICWNIIYNIENTDDINKDVTENCWCTDDSVLIENKLYDGYDNIYKGLLNYSIYDPSCFTLLRTITKVNLTGIYELNNNELLYLTVFPNPVSERIHMKAITAFNCSLKIEIFDYLGHTMYNENIDSNRDISIDTSTLSQGFYYIRVTGETFSETKKILKM